MSPPELVRARREMTWPKGHTPKGEGVAEGVGLGIQRGFLGQIPPGALSASMALPFSAEWPAGVRDGTFLRFLKVDWQETAPSENSICLAGLGTKACKLENQTPEDGGFGEAVNAAEEAKQENSVHRAQSSGASCKPLQCLCFLCKAHEVRITQEKCWEAGLRNPIT